jgi:hypothetical protein
MKPYKIAMAIIMMAVTVNTFGQSMTYNHDASKMGQIQVMELGAGVLTPDLYYSITHSGYKKGAKSATSVKNTLRMAANIASMPQVEYADSIKADLEGRAKVEATNIADRQIDIAWLTEGERIRAKLRAFKSNIGSLNGKTCSEEITAWEDLEKMYDFAIKTTKKAYMPNSERQKQYLAIYDEITTTNDNLLLRIRYLATKRQADNIVAAMTQFHHRVSENATASYNRWRNSANDAGTVKHKTNR